MWAIKNGHYDSVNFLLDKSDSSLKLKNGDTLLHLAARYGHPQIVKFLIEKDYAKPSDNNKANNNNENPVFLACQKGDLGSLQLLIIHGADISIMNNYGESPLTIAFKRGHTQIIEYLTKHILNDNSKTVEEKVKLFTAPNKRGLTVFYDALCRSNFDAALILIKSLKESGLSGSCQAQILLLNNKEEVTKMSNILLEYKVKGEIETIFKVIETFKLKEAVIYELASMRNPREATKFKLVLKAQNLTLFKRILSTIQKTELPLEIKENIYSVRGGKRMGLLYKLLQDLELTTALCYIEGIQEYIGMKKLDDFMTLDFPEVGSIIHGLLIATARHKNETNMKKRSLVDLIAKANDDDVLKKAKEALRTLEKQDDVLDRLKKVLGTSRTYHLFKSIFDSQLPIIIERKSISNNSLKVLNYKDSNEFWNKMEEILGEIKIQINKMELALPETLCQDEVKTYSLDSFIKVEVSELHSSSAGVIVHDNRLLTVFKLSSPESLADFKEICNANISNINKVFIFGGIEISPHATSHIKSMKLSHGLIQYFKEKDISDIFGEIGGVVLNRKLTITHEGKIEVVKTIKTEVPTLTSHQVKEFKFLGSEEQRISFIPEGWDMESSSSDKKVRVNYKNKK
jgi:hypothetical protein